MTLILPCDGSGGSCGSCANVEAVVAFACTARFVEGEGWRGRAMESGAIAGANIVILRRYGGAVLWVSGLRCGGAVVLLWWL